jgi:polygalacturonase
VCVFSVQDLAVRIKTERGRGGGAEDILYENLHGVTQGGIQLTSNYDPGLPRTNVSATPVIRRITIRNVTANTEARKKNQQSFVFLLLSNLVQLCLCLSRACLGKASFYRTKPH